MGLFFNLRIPKNLNLKGNVHLLLPPPPPYVVKSPYKFMSLASSVVKSSNPSAPPSLPPSQRTLPYAEIAAIPDTKSKLSPFTFMPLIISNFIKFMPRSHLKVTPNLSYEIKISMAGEAKRFYTLPYTQKQLGYFGGIKKFKQTIADC